MNKEEIQLRPGHLRYSSPIRSTECDQNGRVHLSELFSFSQEAADRQSSLISISSRDIFPLGYSWMLSGMSLRLLGPRPGWNDLVLVETWGQGFKGIRFMRNYLFFRNTPCRENLFAVGNSEWFVAETASHMPQRPVDLPFLKNLCERPKGEELLPFRPPRLPSLLDEQGSSKDKQACASYERMILWSDLDRNHHLNNTKYVSLAMDALGLTMHQKLNRAEGGELIVSGFDIQFASEVFINEVLRLSTFESEIGKDFLRIADPYLESCSNFLPERQSYLVEGFNLTRPASAFRARISLSESADQDSRVR